MKTTKTILFVLLTSTSAACIFWAFHPHVVYSGLTKEPLGGALLNHWRALSLENMQKEGRWVAEDVADYVRINGLPRSSFEYFVQAPFTEEIYFRGGFVLLPALLLSTEKRWVRILLWILLVVPAAFWALSHYYTLIPQTIVFQGGLINGSCIIYAPDTKLGKGLGMCMAIGLHALANLFYVLLFHSLLNR